MRFASCSVTGRRIGGLVEDDRARPLNGISQLCTGTSPDALGSFPIGGELSSLSEVTLLPVIARFARLGSGDAVPIGTPSEVVVRGTRPIRLADRNRVVAEIERPGRLGSPVLAEVVGRNVPAARPSDAGA